MASRPEKGMPTATAQGEIPAVAPPTPPPEQHVPEMRGQGVHAKALRIRAFWSEIGRTPGCPTCETPGPGSHTLANAKHIKMPGMRAAEPHQREEAKRGVVADSDTRTTGPRVEVRRIPSRRGRKNDLCDRRQLEPADDENVSKKARVARNVLHIRGEDSVKFDVNEESNTSEDKVQMKKR